MSAFRTRRPLLVDARQSQTAETVVTDTGFQNVRRGDWIITGEDGERYVVDDAFFQRTFAPIESYPGELMSEGRSYGC